MSNVLFVKLHLLVVDFFGRLFGGVLVLENRPNDRKDRLQISCRVESVARFFHRRFVDFQIFRNDGVLSHPLLAVHSFDSEGTHRWS